MRRTRSKPSRIKSARTLPGCVLVVLMLAAVLAGCGTTGVTTSRVKTRVDPNKVTAAQLNSELARLKDAGTNPNAMTVLEVAAAELGKKYEWGGNGPDTWDCSALVRHAYACVGVDLPRVTYDQVNTGRPVALSELAPGDMVFFRGNSHVGLYVGDGIFLHAYPPSVRAERLARYQGAISAMRRVL